MTIWRFYKLCPHDSHTCTKRVCLEGIETDFCEQMARQLTDAGKRFLARRNPEKLAREKRELEVMTDEEIDAYLAPLVSG